MTAQADIDALIQRADVDYRTADKTQRQDFAGVTAMAGLTILARQIDALGARLDAIELEPGSGLAGVQWQLTELGDRIERLSAEVRQDPPGLA